MAKPKKTSPGAGSGPYGEDQTLAGGALQIDLAGRPLLSSIRQLPARLGSSELKIARSREQVTRPRRACKAGTGLGDRRAS